MYVLRKTRNFNHIISRTQFINLKQFKAPTMLFSIFTNFILYRILIQLRFSQKNPLIFLTFVAIFELICEEFIGNFIILITLVDFYSIKTCRYQLIIFSSGERVWAKMAYPLMLQLPLIHVKDVK